MCTYIQWSAVFPLSRSCVTQDVSIAVSIQTIVLIAVDRFGAVVFPLRSPLASLNPRLLLILCTWIVAISTHFTSMFVAIEVVEYLPRKLLGTINTETLENLSSLNIA